MVGGPKHRGWLVPGHRESHCHFLVSHCAQHFPISTLASHPRPSGTPGARLKRNMDINIDWLCLTPPCGLWGDRIPHSTLGHCPILS